MHNILARFRNSLEVNYTVLLEYTVGSSSMDQMNRNWDLPFDELLVPSVESCLWSKNQGSLPGKQLQVACEESNH